VRDRERERAKERERERERRDHNLNHKRGGRMGAGGRGVGCCERRDREKRKSSRRDLE
jgi:hypothetical protein